MRLLITLLFLPATFAAQSFAVLSTVPAAQTLTPPDYYFPFAAEFNTTIDPATVTAENVQVFGRWTGVMNGQLSLDPTGKKIQFYPSKAFIKGDWVTIKITSAVTSTSGSNLPGGYAWQFWVPTETGVLQQSPFDTIFLRLPGEGQIQTYGAYAGDLDGDGASDLTVINETSDDLRILLNDGAGNYPDFTVHDMGSSTPSPNEGADFDHDGTIDLAVSTAHDDELRVLYGDGAGNFSGPTLYPTGAGARGVAVLDCNGDSWDDIFVTNRLASNITLFVNSNGAFPVQNTLTTPATGETACVATDIDENGVPDVFVASFTDGQLLTLLGNGNCTFSVADQIDLPGQPWMIAAGDLDADGHVDVVSANSSGNSFSVVFGDGTGQLSAPVNYTDPAVKFPIAIDLGDLDGDGDLDLVTSNYVSNNFTVFANDGNGGFSLAKVLPALQNASCAILHDRDLDGDLDITGTDETADVVLLFENKSDGVGVYSTGPGGLRVFPNPARAGEKISILPTQNARTILTLTDIHGVQRQLHHTELPASIPPGVYWLEIDTGEHLVSRHKIFIF